MAAMCRSHHGGGGAGMADRAAFSTLLQHGSKSGCEGPLTNQQGRAQLFIGCWDGCRLLSS